MATLTEGDLRIDITDKAHVRRFDDEATHPLSHCMKAVDFIIEWEDRYWFVELKDPQNPNAREEARSQFADKLRRAQLDTDFVYKYRDTLLYEWAAGRTQKPITYMVLISLDTLDPPLLLTRQDDLRRKLPAADQGAPEWRYPIATDCLVFNIDAWNHHLGDKAAIRREVRTASPLLRPHRVDPRGAAAWAEGGGGGAGGAAGGGEGAVGGGVGDLQFVPPPYLSPYSRARHCTGVRTSTPRSTGKCRTLPVTMGQAAARATAMNGASSGSGRTPESICLAFRQSARAARSSRRLLTWAGLKPKRARQRTSRYSAISSRLTTGCRVCARWRRGARHGRRATRGQ